MKKSLAKKSFWQSILSTLAIVAFAYMALASFGVDQEKKQLPDGRWEITSFYSGGDIETTTGNLDEAGRWEGPVTISYDPESVFDTRSTEEVNMKEGKRHGLSKTSLFGGSFFYQCYQHGEKVNSDLCEQAENKNTNDLSANAILAEKVPWFTFKLAAFGFDQDYVKSYLDTLELLLYANEFAEDEFGDTYNDVLDVLEETPYDSIIQKNDEYSIVNGLDLILNHEFRLATLHAYMKGDSNTFHEIKTTYPNYLTELSGLEVSEPDFETFCSDYDSIMSGYESIAANDPNLMDSLDARMFQTMDIISSGEEDEEAKSALYKSAISSIDFRSIQRLSNKYLSEFKTQRLNLTPEEVSEEVLFTFLVKFVYGDLLISAVREAYAIRMGIVRLPAVTTNFEAYTSSGSVSLSGNVLEDGGGEITSRGIAWGSVYNPNQDNQVVNSGAGIGEFSVELTGLMEGQTYYARTFAENSAGIAYGNCISFIAQNATDIETQDLIPLDFAIYPNPARDQIAIRINAEEQNGLQFTVYDMEGKVVLRKELKDLDPGEKTIKIDLSELESGMYSTQIRGKNIKPAVQKLLIVR